MLYLFVAIFLCQGKIFPNRVDKNTHIFGLNGCDNPAPMPKIQYEDGDLVNFFYTMKVDDIPNFQFDEATNSVKLPMGKMWTGWYYHSANVEGVLDYTDAGVFEWFTFPNPASLFDYCNWGMAENLMTVLKDGELMSNYEQDKQKIEMRETKSSDKYEWKAPYGEDHHRRWDVNMHGAMTSAQKQFAALSFDLTQQKMVRDNPGPIPSFSGWEQLLEENIGNLEESDLRPGEGPYLKVATNCLHGWSDPLQTEFDAGVYSPEYITIELDKEWVHNKGQTLFPHKIWTNLAARANWKYDQEKGTLQLLLRGFQMGYLNAQEFPKQVKYFQGAPFTDDDHRINEDPEMLRPFCNIPEKLNEIPPDTHMFWENLETVCPETMMNEFKDIVESSDFNECVTEKGCKFSKEFKLVASASNYVQCASNYMRSYIEYSHGYDFLEAGAFLHFLLEFHPPYIAGFITHPDLNQFKIDYIYGKEGMYKGGQGGSYKSVTLQWFLDMFKLGDISQSTTTAGGIFAVHSMHILAIIGILSIAFGIWKRCLKKDGFSAVPEQEI